MNLLQDENSIILPQIVRGLKEMGFEQLTPIQEQAIPAMLEGKDLIGQAQTGTGKTAAFGIPLVQMIDPSNDSVQALVLCPTRELAIQAAEGLRKFSKYMHGVMVLPIYGGQDITKQIRSLRGKVSIVVGTPGRVMDHIRRHTLKLNDIKMMVLDEADEMLNMGFREDIETILKEIPSEHQTALFSATMPKAILDITKEYQKENAEIIKVAHKELTIPLVKQYYYEVNSNNKEDVAARLLDYYNPKLSLIFCNTKHMVDTLCENLKGRGYFAEGLHGDMSQHQRDKVMNGFRNGHVDILIATDVAARGIDVDDVEAVINYDIPQDIEYYVHRIGRTGRAGRKGRAFTLVVGKEIFKIREIERVCKTTMKARNIPSGKDVTAAKADSVFERVNKLREEDLTDMINLIQNKMEELDCTAMDIAAAFLKLEMGEESKDILVEKFVPRNRYDKRQGSGDRNGRGRGQRGRDGRDRDDRGGRGRDGRFRDRDDRGGRNRDDRAPRDRDDRGGRNRDDRSPRDRDDRGQWNKNYDKKDKKFDKKDGKDSKDYKKRDNFKTNDDLKGKGYKKERKAEKDDIKRVIDEYESLMLKKKKNKKVNKESKDKRH